MDKNTFINNLSKVKIIIGNGFDLHCLLRTSYNDYFSFNHKRYDQLRKWCEEFELKDNYSLEDETILDINTWDVFFALNSSMKFSSPRNWCDIEKMIYSSLMNHPSENDNNNENLTANYMISNIHWNDIKFCVLGNYSATSRIEKFVVWILKKRRALLDIKSNNYYGFLLDELIAFEKSFGRFVYDQTHHGWMPAYYKDTPNKTYNELAVSTISELVSNNTEIVSIDSFNYSSFGNKQYEDLIFHINGNYENPIFGIDTVFEPNDERFIFTKTYRRIMLNFVNNNHKIRQPFQNVVIYGHSLNSADYSYFFPVFDQIKLLDSLANGVLIFAYSVFDENRRNKIESDLRSNISNIIYAYGLSKKLSEPGRLLVH